MSKAPTKPASKRTSVPLFIAQADAAAMPEAVPAVARTAPPRLGEMVHVVVGVGVQLKNNETGGFFPVGVPTPQTVTVTTLRRLTDGDLQLA
ncbi:hypothetical protein [Variovorax paradoxus]|uniref:Uncharacterized protein n=1 Tax=Variovorax paradoxus TaxID=34073 RepID=A0A0H2LWV8_VARPD|nr:hypothetical protein [Variovorax paradoxus]KLN54728.1 hypothetical protein VPARA_40320 [Variovorax paradoxus]